MLNKFFAFIILIIASPIFCAVGFMIFFEDGVPIVYSQKRPGKNHILFNFYKFRTMKKDTPEVATHLLTNPNQYLLRIGSFLRKFSLDELPNLINVIKGDIGFVGPRPALYNQDDLISLRVKYGIDRLRPGITGWAQINGRDEISIEEKVELEKYYLDHKSFYFDIKILFLTFKYALLGKGVSH